MPHFTIETTYRLPVFRQRTYEAATLEQACQAAQTDTDWTGSTADHQSAGEIFVSGVWPGTGTAYTAPSVRVPSQFGETLHRKAEHFETLLGILKVLLTEEAFTPAKLAFWRRRAELATAKAEAILAGEPDPR